jgi:hypothetical protein
VNRASTGNTAVSQCVSEPTQSAAAPHAAAIVAQSGNPTNRTGPRVQ